MNMNKETYERLMMDVTKFDVEDVITTSGVGPIRRGGRYHHLRRRSRPRPRRQRPP